MSILISIYLNIQPQPVDDDPVTFGQQDQAERRVDMAREVPLLVIVHLPSQLPAQSQILARHVVQAPLSLVDCRHEEKAAQESPSGVKTMRKKSTTRKKKRAVMRSRSRHWRRLMRVVMKVKVEVVVCLG